MSVNKYDASTGELTNIASGQRTWVGTQEAYKAAKQAGTLPNNAIIAITDDEVDHNHYSTDETETGMYWINGKPIYRKVFETTTPATADTDTTMFTIANDVDEIIDLKGFVEYAATQKEPINWSYSGSTPYMATYCRVESGVWKIAQKAISGRNNKPEFIIVEYTKTTD